MVNFNHQYNFDQIILALEFVGEKIKDWRDDPEMKKIHVEKDFKTEADLKAHQIICEKLNEITPGIGIISEEDYSHSDKRPDAYWIIDPIDGTSSWYNGYYGFVTQVAYIENDIPVFGAIHAPVLKQTWSALKGQGAYINGEILPKLKADARLILIDNTEKPHGIAKKMMKSLPITGYVECGSLGLKTVLVADGTVDLFIKDVCVRDWDLAPAAVILSEVGGYLIQANNTPYLFNGNYEKDNGFIVGRNMKIIEMALDVFKSK